uniref:Uncharacterized protein n=1 Tax=Alexandrium monilatum TaxID=311494 RepID=A0A7S4PZQ2_9DINO
MAQDGKGPGRQLPCTPTPGRDSGSAGRVHRCQPKHVGRQKPLEPMFCCCNERSKRAKPPEEGEPPAPGQEVAGGSSASSGGGTGAPPDQPLAVPPQPFPSAPAFAGSEPPTEAQRAAPANLKAEALQRSEAAKAATPLASTGEAPAEPVLAPAPLEAEPPAPLAALAPVAEAPAAPAAGADAPAAATATAGRDEAKEAAALKIQAVHRGKIARAEAEAMREEQWKEAKAPAAPAAAAEAPAVAALRAEATPVPAASAGDDEAKEAAALKIQAVHRGKVARAEVEAAREERRRAAEAPAAAS